MLFTEAVYAIWNKRNSKIFQNHFLQPRQVIKDVIFKVAARCKDDDKTMLFTQVVICHECVWKHCYLLLVARRDYGLPLVCIVYLPYVFDFQ